MKKQLLVLCAVTAAFVTACSKDDENPAGGKDRLVSKVTSIDENDTTVFNVTHDNKGRIVSYNAADNSEQSIFSYTGGGNVNRIEYISESEKTVYEVNYNGNGQPTTATVEHFDETGELARTEEIEYVVANDKVAEIKVTEDEDQTTYKLEYANNNLTKVQVSMDETFSEISYIYDNKKSPFYSGSKYILDLSFSFLLFSKNNVITQKTTVPPTESTSTYTLNADGYPSASETTITSILGTRKTKTLFEYK